MNVWNSTGKMVQVRIKYSLTQCGPKRQSLSSTLQSLGTELMPHNELLDHSKQVKHQQGLASPISLLTKKKEKKKKWTRE